MKFQKIWIFLTLLAATFAGLAQGTAFTYQGRLSDSGNPANGGYDLRFKLYNDVTNGNQVGPTLTNSATIVSNGLFVVALDFGGVFNGSNYWLEIAARTNGGNAFTILNPRQTVTPAPYAIFASVAGNLTGLLPATQLNGALPSAQISGVYSAGVTFSNSANHFAGAFAGDGSGLTNLVQSCMNVLTAGVTNDGVTDVTVPLQNLLNKGGAFYFPAGRYLAQELIITNNTTLFGSGATLVYAGNSGNKNIFVRCLLNTNINIFNLDFDGGDYSDITTRTFQTYQGIQTFASPDQYFFWNPVGLRHGLQFNTEAGGTISGIGLWFQRYCTIARFQHRNQWGRDIKNRGNGHKLLCEFHGTFFVRGNRRICWTGLSA